MGLEINIFVDYKAGNKYLSLLPPVLGEATQDSDMLSILYLHRSLSYLYTSDGPMSIIVFLKYIPTAFGITNRSPILVLTRPNVVLLHLSNKKRSVQHGIFIAEEVIE